MIITIYEPSTSINVVEQNTEIQLVDSTILGEGTGGIFIQAGNGISITGTGTEGDPYIISLAGATTTFIVDPAGVFLIDPAGNFIVDPQNGSTPSTNFFVDPAGVFIVDFDNNFIVEPQP